MFTFSTFYMVHNIVKPRATSDIQRQGKILLGLACELRRFTP